MNITCRKTDCRHNQNFVCSVHDLKVDRRSLCKDYEKCEDEECERVRASSGSTSKEIQDSSKTMFHKPPKYNPYRSAKHCNICCHAECMFNQKTECHANGITVNDLEEAPYCMTFLKKGD